ncbi:hypothetical protein [Amycolatopsis sp. NPDC004079]|uniref:Uncharacterized protein n=1 Tax=Amycolatopsis halotolerans TaxID=330083 RepID=A0ABV7QPP7_9PSEU
MQTVTLAERYQAPEAASVGCFATDTRRILVGGPRDSRRRFRRRRR